MSKKLSIIVPVYNMAAEGKLNYCLDSLVGQTIRGVYDYEILCVDDASTDESLEILLDYQKRYPELICVIPNAVNLRQGGAKNVGLKNAEGEWIGFIDSDDWVSPDYYEKLLKKAEETGADLVGCDYSQVDHHTFTVGKVIVNNTPDQTGELMEEQHKRDYLTGVPINRLRLQWQWAIAMPRASAVSSGLGTDSRCSIMRVIS